MQSRDSLSNERPLSGVELAVATVAQWPMAVLNPNLPLEKTFRSAESRPSTFDTSGIP